MADPTDGNPDWRPPSEPLPSFEEYDYKERYGVNATCGEVSGERTNSGDLCGYAPEKPDGRCHVHTKFTTEKGGAGRNNTGNPDSLPEPDDEEANEQRALTTATTGMHMGLKRRLKWFEKLGEPYMSLFEDYFIEFAQKAENESQAVSLASAAVIRDEFEEHLLLDGVFYEEMIADPEDLEDKGIDPEKAQEMATVQKPKSRSIENYTELMKELRLGQKYEGITGNDGSSSGGGGSGDMAQLWSGERGEE